MNVEMPLLNVGITGTVAPTPGTQAEGNSPPFSDYLGASLHDMVAKVPSGNPAVSATQTGTRLNARETQIIASDPSQAGTTPINTPAAQQHAFPLTIAADTKTATRNETATALTAPEMAQASQTPLLSQSRSTPSPQVFENAENSALEIPNSPSDATGVHTPHGEEKGRGDIPHAAGEKISQTPQSETRWLKDDSSSETQPELPNHLSNADESPNGPKQTQRGNLLREDVPLTATGQNDVSSLEKVPAENQNTEADAHAKTSTHSEGEIDSQNEGSVQPQQHRLESPERPVAHPDAPASKNSRKDLETASESQEDIRDADTLPAPASDNSTPITGSTFATISLQAMAPPLAAPPPLSSTPAPSQESISSELEASTLNVSGEQPFAETQQSQMQPRAATTTDGTPLGEGWRKTPQLAASGESSPGNRPFDLLSPAVENSAPVTAEKRLDPTRATPSPAPQKAGPKIAAYFPEALPGTEAQTDKSGLSSGMGNRFSQNTSTGENLSPGGGSTLPDPALGGGMGGRPFPHPADLFPNAVSTPGSPGVQTPTKLDASTASRPFTENRLTQETPAVFSSQTPGTSSPVPLPMPFSAITTHPWAASEASTLDSFLAFQGGAKGETGSQNPLDAMPTPGSLATNGPIPVGIAENRSAFSFPAGWAFGIPQPPNPVPVSSFGQPLSLSASTISPTPAAVSSVVNASGDVEGLAPRRESPKKADGDKGEDTPVFSLGTETANVSTPTVTPVREAAAPAPARIVEQVAHKIHVEVQNGRTEMTVHLDPSDLGHLQVHLTSESGKLTASFHTQSAEVRTMLESQLPQLQTALTDAGVQVQQFSFSSGMESGSFTRQNNGQPSPSSRGSQESRGDSASLSEIATVTAPSRRNLNVALDYLA